MTSTTVHPLAQWREQHAGLLAGAREAIRTRGYWSGFPESPSGKIYGEMANAEGRSAFDRLLNAPFALDQPGTIGTVGEERSPYGFPLGITYPRTDLDVLLATAAASMRPWSKLDLEDRTAIVLEILVRLNRASFEIAYATMHTTGQGFLMAFQAAGPHAQDRALEAVAYAYDEMAKIPREIVWEKPQGKHPPLRMLKRYRIVPRGVSVAIGCSTFPTWNSYPGIFASLMTGNPVIVKPHPQSTLPLALTVKIARDAIRDAGCDPNVVLLAADSSGAPIAKELVTRPAVAIVDYTGGSAFGEWIEKNVRAQIYTEKAGVNPVVIDSTDDLKGMARNLAMSISLYSGQMCTAPQNLFIPREGIRADGGEHKSFDEVVSAITGGVESLLSVPERASEVLGAIATDATLERLERETRAPGVVLESRVVSNPQFPDARVRTPVLVRMDAGEMQRYEREMFGPIAYAIATDSTAQSLELAARSAKERGAITAIVYSTDEPVIEAAEEKAAEGGVSLAVNLTGPLLVNQSAAFSDFHVTGANPAGNASLTDAAFVANRFRVVQTRIPQTA